MASTTGIAENYPCRPDYCSPFLAATHGSDPGSTPLFAKGAHCSVHFACQHYPMSNSESKGDRSTNYVNMQLKT
jgi:hypothetical protein